MEPIAVVGISCLFPQASNATCYWENILARQDASRPIDFNRLGLNPELLLGIPGQKEKMFTPRCAFVDENIDISFLKGNKGLPCSPEKLDLYYQWLFHLTHEALLDSGIKKPLEENFKKTGMILSTLTFALEKGQEQMEDLIRALLTWEKGGKELISQLDLDKPEAFYNTHQSAMPALLTSKIFNFDLPGFALDAACASSLYALFHGCDQLHNRVADRMVVAGINRSEMVALLTGFSQLSALSPRGICRPFDTSGDGLVVGEGGGVLILKRLSDALAAKDNIHALIRHVGLSCDGRGTGLLSPDSKGQQLALKKAYQESGVHPDEIDYVECHGTAAPRGDRTEVETMTSIFWGENSTRRTPLRMGSIKSLVGHCLAAAGMAGVFKMILALKNKILPPSICEFPIPGISENPTKFFLQDKAEPWLEKESGKPRTCAVSGFGFGGTNAHLILEEFTKKSETTHYPVPDKKSLKKIAVVAMGAHLGGVGGHFSLWKRLSQGVQKFFSPPEGRWPKFEWEKLFPEFKGGLFESFLEIDLKKFRMNPGQVKKLLPQQLLVAKVAIETLEAFNLQESLKGRADVGVLIGLNWMAGIAEDTTRLKSPRLLSKIEQDLNLNFSENEREIWIETLKNSLSLIVDSDSVMGDIPNFPANRISSEADSNGPSYVVFQEDSSGLLALKLGIESIQRGDTRSMIVGAVDFPGDFKIIHSQLSDASRPPLEHPADSAVVLVLEEMEFARKNNRSILAEIESVESFMELKTQPPIGRENSGQDEGIKGSLAKIKINHGLNRGDTNFPPSPNELNPFYGEDFWGRARGCSGLLGVLSGCEMLRKRVRLLGGRGFNPRRKDNVSPWIRNQKSLPRKVLVEEKTPDEINYKVLLKEVDYHPNGNFYHPEKLLFVFKERDQKTLVSELKEFQKILREGDPSFHWMRQMEKFQKSPDQGITYSFIANSMEEVKKQVQGGISWIENGKGPLLDPSGRFFQPKPFGATGTLALIYPGFGNVYHGMGRQLSLIFPHLLERISQRSQLIEELSLSDKIWGDQELDPFTLTTSDITLSTTFNSCLYTDLFLNDFKVPARLVLGHSGGELNCLSALGVWNSDQYFTKKEFQTLFIDQLAGDFLSVKKYFNTQKHLTWESYLLFGSPEKIREALKGHERVFLTMVNSPDESMVSGVGKDCRSFLKASGFEHRQIPIPQVYHHPILEQHRSELLSFWNNPVHVPKNLTFYSHASGEPYHISSDNCAKAITRTASEFVNFIPVVEHAYHKNSARIFLELGPQNSVCRYVESILKGKEFVAIPANTSQRDEFTQLLFALGQLSSHGIWFDPEVLLNLERGKQSPAEIAFPTGLSAGRVLGSADFTRLGKKFLEAPSHQVPEKGGKKAFKIHLVPPPIEGIMGGKSNPLKEDSLKNWDKADRLEKVEISVQQLVPERSLSMSDHDNNPSSHQVFLGNQPGETLLKSYIQLQNRVSELQGQFLELQFHELESKNSLPLFPGGNEIFEEKGLDFSNSDTNSQEKTSLDAVGKNPIPPYIPPGDKTPPEKFIDNLPVGQVLFDKNHILSFANGSLADVFGPDFAQADHFKFRTRFPVDPYLFVDRITAMEGTPKKLKPGTVVTEYDVKEDAWFLENGRVPIAVSIESGQADLWLISYLGIDFIVNGERAYRLLGCELTYYQDLPKPPCTLKYEIKINSFVKHEGVHLFYFNGYGYVNGQLFIKWENGCAGYFTYEELGQKKPYVFPVYQKDLNQIPYSPVRYPDKSIFNHEDLLALTRGDYAACFGEGYALPLPTSDTLKLANEKILMVHRVTQVNIHGGSTGSGLVEGEFDLQDDIWYFNCHFPKDPVLAGTLILDGCAQLLQFYMMYLGFGFQFKGAHFQPIKYSSIDVKCRGQVIPGNKLMSYHLDILKFEPGSTPQIWANVTVLCDGKEVVHVKNFGYEIATQGLPKLPPPGEQAFDIYGRPVVVNESQILELTIGKPSRYFGDHYLPFDRERQISRMPNLPYGTISRVLELKGEKQKIVRGVEMVSEFDFHPNDWFFELNHGTMPFCVFNEVVLQPCGLISQLLELDFLSDKDRFIRNLNGRMIQHAEIPMGCGRIIEKVVLKDIVAMPDMFIVNLDGSYHTPEGLLLAEGFELKFGFGSQAALKGAPGFKLTGKQTQDLKQGNAAAQNSALKPPPLHQVGWGRARLPQGALQFLDEPLELLPQGGQLRKGYVKARKWVNPKEWIFFSHFYMDPVVPGSYSLEAIGQLLQYYLLATLRDQGGLESCHLRMCYDTECDWGYRGQILQTNKEITYEGEIIERGEAPHPWLIGNGRVWVDGKLIYLVNNMKVGLVD